jgi:hypothetical protein
MGVIFFHFFVIYIYVHFIQGCIALTSADTLLLFLIFALRLRDLIIILSFVSKVLEGGECFESPGLNLLPDLLVYSISDGLNHVLSFPEDSEQLVELIQSVHNGHINVDSFDLLLGAVSVDSGEQSLDVRQCSQLSLEFIKDVFIVN